MRHSTECSATPSPEVVMTNDALLVISHAWPQHVPTHNGHGLPGCEPSQGSTLLSLLAALDDPGAALFEFSGVCQRGSFGLSSTWRVLRPSSNRTRLAETVTLGIVFSREPPVVLRGRLGWSRSAAGPTLARFAQADPASTNAVLSEMHRTWNRQP